MAGPARFVLAQFDDGRCFRIYVGELKHGIGPEEITQKTQEGKSQKTPDHEVYSSTNKKSLAGAVLPWEGVRDVGDTGQAHIEYF